MILVSQLLQKFRIQRAALIDDVEVAVFTVRVDQAILVNHRSVDAPLEAVRVVRYATDGTVRVARTAQRVGVLELPLHGQIGAELRDEEFLRARWIRGRAIFGTDRGVITIRAETAVVVVLDHHRVGPIMLKDRHGAVPAEVVRAQIGAVGREVH